jgi:hypothetical protein
MIQYLEGNKCGLIEIPSRYLPEGTEENDETPQDMSRSAHDCRQMPPKHSSQIYTVSYGNAELFRETVLRRRGGTALGNKHTAKKTPSALTK